jgi:hypothetical protein
MFVLRFAITLSLASAFWYSVYGQGGKLDKATEMFTAAQELGLPIDEKIYTNMLNCYGKSGQFLPCVDKSEKNSISTYDECPVRLFILFSLRSLKFIFGREASGGIFTIQQNEGGWYHAWKGMLLLAFDFTDMCLEIDQCD